MEILNVNNVNPIDETDLSIILDCEIKDSSGNSVPLNNVSVVVSIFDSTNNFIGQKLIAGERFKYQWDSKEDLLLYLRDEIIDIDDNEDLNPGRYQLRFSFILDTFNSVENEENRFIVTEISPDRTEIRLNPLSNERTFIDTFTRIKNYKKSAKELKLNSSAFADFYTDYVNSVFSNESVNDIFSDDEVRVDGQSFSEYLQTVYKKRSSISVESERIADAEEKADKAIEEMKQLLTSKKGDAIIVASQYFEEEREDLFRALRNTPVGDNTKRNTLLNEFKMGLKNIIEEFLKDAIDEIVDMVLQNSGTGGEEKLPTQEEIDDLIDEPDPIDIDDRDDIQSPDLVVDDGEDTTEQPTPIAEDDDAPSGTGTGDDDSFTRDLTQFQVR